MTAAETEPHSAKGGSGQHLVLERVAAGDRVAFGNLYDAFATETYAICLYHSANQTAAEKSMTKAWIFIWSHAAALNNQSGSTQSIVLSTTWSVTSKRSQQPARKK
ncbi:hypothetical protein GY21_15360 [Cryobacterium roopkundense]|uniref:RNA polymerase sigma-70 region 2 domain-containing protein n=1 Tax=Cryobacterium roopkundense TaxID=1001240 RepID=A0A099J326_9MICO|nr:hypothetical protein [Cryobacterium roopkundense]KGJ72455.1 hypothetical protein GY21_15360 [Cryobacterium roopkundense]MBB5641107.1 hypothetical protein [Cryobacterium roopkundense]